MEGKGGFSVAGALIDSPSLVVIRGVLELDPVLEESPLAVVVQTVKRGLTNACTVAM